MSLPGAGPLMRTPSPSPIARIRAALGLPSVDQGANYLAGVAGDPHGNPLLPLYGAGRALQPEPIHLGPSTSRHPYEPPVAGGHVPTEPVGVGIHPPIDVNFGHFGGPAGSPPDMGGHVPTEPTAVGGHHTGNPEQVLADLIRHLQAQSVYRAGHHLNPSPISSLARAAAGLGY